ncbi:MAG: hypothetical protein GFH27_549279n437 [Chloroflexi bacterium AL-W]|nr:hypothetical protein [Chloroflexi bacterium AL-N1]NOK65403.1 hypothetical protein [Chloroflexi bacterium AL-N10]NOK72331.1 hypothetical protein [Chloroflexi bacterium AL-N5]NOK79582.1 hypothetical protein [Chloroflexi bacterium AL-W]NOK87498.1 hypothetical protein [Chloroflexi bacterium AL-N15]
MRINVPKLMYQTFQHCRLVRSNTDNCLQVLAVALTMLQHSTTFIVPVPRSVAKCLPHDVAEKVSVIWFPPIHRHDMIHTDARPFLTLASIATQDLQRFWREEQTQPIRALGYALHNLHAFVRTPSCFDRECYFHSFYIAGRYWANMSPALQHQFCAVMNLSCEEAQKILSDQEIQLSSLSSVGEE